MDYDEANALAEYISSLECVDDARVFTPTDAYDMAGSTEGSRKSYDGSEEDDAWYVEFEPALRYSYGWMEVPHELLRALADRDLCLRKDRASDGAVWEAWPREMDESEEFVNALIAIERIVDEAADARKSVRPTTVDEARALFTDLNDRGRDLDGVVPDIIEDLERISDLAASHGRRVDHMAVCEVATELELELADRGHL